MIVCKHKQVNNFAGPLALGVLDHNNQLPSTLRLPGAVLGPKAGESWLSCGLVVA